MMKHEYDRLKRKINKHASRERHRENQDALAASGDVDELVLRLEEAQTQLSASESERRRLAKEMETMESNNRTLADKCNFLQNQSSSYQKQLTRRREHLDSTEQALRDQLEQVEKQLSHARDTVNSQVSAGAVLTRSCVLVLS